MLKATQPLAPQSSMAMKICKVKTARTYQYFQKDHILSSQPTQNTQFLNQNVRVYYNWTNMKAIQVIKSDSSNTAFMGYYCE